MSKFTIDDAFSVNDIVGVITKDKAEELAKTTGKVIAYANDSFGVFFFSDDIDGFFPVTREPRFRSWDKMNFQAEDSAFMAIGKATFGLYQLKTVEELLYFENRQQLHRMDIYSKAGEKVIFDAGGGYNWDKKNSLEKLELGKEYVVSRVEVGQSSSRVFLEDFLGQGFNTCLFGTNTPSEATLWPFGTSSSMVN